MSALTFAIPSKGRLKDQTEAWLAAQGLTLVQEGGARGYVARLLEAPEVEVRLHSAGEIARTLLTGDAHLGVTGEDVLREAAGGDLTGRAALLAGLGFGFADLVVATPMRWADVVAMADLVEAAAAYRARQGRRMRVATKYVALASRFFAAHGVSDHRIVESLGATEGAPAAGVAEVIVDITTTGATLTANHLKVLDDGVILKSQAQLVQALAADWTPAARAAAGPLIARIPGCAPLT